MEGQVRTLRESESVGGTHELSSADGGSSQDTKTRRESEGHSQTVERRRGTTQDARTKQESEGHSLPAKCRRRDKSGH
jgi:hypothetical protein